jgi:hypothetical protein
MTFTAIRPISGRERAGDVAVSVAGFLVDLGTQSGLQRLVGIVGAEEIGVAEEETLLV